MLSRLLLLTHFFSALQPNAAPWQFLAHQVLPLVLYFALALGQEDANMAIQKKNIQSTSTKPTQKPSPLAKKSHNKPLQPSKTVSLKVNQWPPDPC